MVNGVLDLSAAGVVVYTLAVTHITIAAVTIYLHRHQAHRALELHPVISHFFRFWLWLTTSMVTKQWVAVHRKHHAKCETPEDPHSPQVLGLRRVLLEGAELYAMEAKNPDTLARYGRGAPDDWVERRVYTGRNAWGIFLMLGINVLLLGPIGISVWGIQMIWIPFWAAGVINGVGHAIGYRTFASADASTNIVPWGILIGGEELHNNHHAYPGSAKLSARGWEFDIGWFYIRTLEILGLAAVKKVAPPPARVTGKSLDLEAVRAIFTARFQVLAGYGRHVLARVHRDELRRSHRGERALLKAARRALRRDESLLDPGARESLRRAMEHSESLRVAYQFRERLQEIWRQSAAAGPEGMLKELQEWCRQAEASGVRALQEFSTRLAGYRLQGRSA